MREALLKRRYGIPAVLLLVLLCFGTVLAWYSFNTIESRTTVKEPISSETVKEFSDNMWPGETNTWLFDIVNSADKRYTVKADLTYSAPTGVSIDSFVVGGVGKTDDLTDDNFVVFAIPADKTLSCEMVITAENDAAPGTVSAEFKLSRG